MIGSTNILKEYLIKEEITQDIFAKKVGLTRRTITRYCTTLTIPTPKNIKRIYLATNGQVTQQDFYDQALAKISELINQ